MQSRSDTSSLCHLIWQGADPTFGFPTQIGQKRGRVPAAVPRRRRQRVIWLHEPAIDIISGRAGCVVRRVGHDSARSARNAYVAISGPPHGSFHGGMGRTASESLEMELSFVGL